MVCLLGVRYHLMDQQRQRSEIHMACQPEVRNPRHLVEQQRQRSEIHMVCLREVLEHRHLVEQLQQRSVIHMACLREVLGLQRSVERQTRLFLMAVQHPLPQHHSNKKTFIVVSAELRIGRPTPGTKMHFDIAMQLYKKRLLYKF